MFFFSVIVVDSTPCTFEVKGSSGNISSDLLGNYKVCSWSISAPRGYKLRLNFTIFQLSDIPAFKVHSWIHVYDGKSTNAPLLGVYTGTRKPFTVQSSGSFLLVKLSVNYNDFTSRTFKAVFISSTTTGEYCPFIYF